MCNHVRLLEVSKECLPAVDCCHKVRVTWTNGQQLFAYLYASEISVLTPRLGTKVFFNPPLSKKHFEDHQCSIFKVINIFKRCLKLGAPQPDPDMILSQILEARPRSESFFS